MDELGTSSYIQELNVSTTEGHPTGPCQALESMVPVWIL